MVEEREMDGFQQNCTFEPNQNYLINSFFKKLYVLTEFSMFCFRLSVQLLAAL